EHSTITSWGRQNELHAMNNMLDQFPNGLVAVVSDSYDIFKACREYWGGSLREKVLGRNGTVVIRPDSGKPEEVLAEVLNILGERFGSSLNGKGFRVLPNQIRVIQGDGIDYESTARILNTLRKRRVVCGQHSFRDGWCSLQKLDRDT
ncbi:Nicotinamide phosphoribosyltransferase, partial [mine drainage metagenome]